jgi:peptidoglycan/LPS O-acetylase OafA/YrhL
VTLENRTPPARKAGLTWIAEFPSRFQRKMSGGAYRPEVDGLRFFAIAFVIFGHSLERAARFFASYRDSLEGGTLETYLQLAPFGVCLFFTISGFIIANQAIRANKSPLDGAFLKAYFGRRVLRIEPPYILLLIATWLMIVATGYVPEGTHRFYAEPQSLNVSLIASIFYVHDLFWNTFPRLFPPGWSLEVEVQFYLCAPLLLWLWTRVEGARNRLTLALAIGFLAVLMSLWDLQQAGPFYLDFSLVRFFNYFWLGIALAHFQEPIRARVAAAPAWAATATGWLGLAICILLPAPRHPPFFPECLRLPAVDLALAAVFASTFAPRSGFRRFCASPWISLIGGACYSIYLVHLQVIQVLSGLVFRFAPGLPLVGVAAAMALIAIVVVAVGLIYYVQIERRFMTRDWHRLALDAAKRYAASWLSGRRLASR